MTIKLPIKQIRKSQWSALQLLVEPDTKIMQTDFGRQTSVQTREQIRAFTCQPKGIEQLIENRLNQLTQISQPLTPFLGSDTLAALMGSSDEFCIEELTPALIWHVSRKAFVSNVSHHTGVFALPGRFLRDADHDYLTGHTRSL